METRQQIVRWPLAVAGQGQWRVRQGIAGLIDNCAAGHDARGEGDTEDLTKFDVPTLIMHGDDDQVVPIADSAMLSS